MTTWLRRLFWLGLLAGAACGVATALKRRNDPPATAAPAGVAPPAPAARRSAFTEISDTPDDTAAPSSSGRSGSPAQRWQEPVDGACPAGYPIKANAKSEIYHVPGGRFYERTIPERCYATAEDAEADGYRRSKA
jgi:hypothetical protein